MTSSQIYEGCFMGDGENEPTNWKLGRKIARGINTQVSHVLDKNKLHEKKCVVKQAFMSDDTDIKSLTSIELEMKALQKVKHNRVVPYIGFSRNDLSFSLFLPYMEKGSLARIIKSQDVGHLTEEKTALFTSQILEGLDYLHKLRIIHRDIKASNVLMKNDFEIQISDFGVSKILNTLSKAQTKGAGTMNWMAPEIFQEIPYDNKVDIWSLGCTVYQMITGNIPFNELTEPQIVVKGLNSALQLSIPEHLSLSLKDFLCSSLTNKPCKRPTALDLLHHIFITRNNMDCLEDKQISTSEKEDELISTRDMSTYVADDHNRMASGEEISTYFTGTHEVQECLEGQGEVDLHSHLASCKKNPGHKNFVPVNQLRVEHFPSGYHDNNVCDLTKAIADLTVRIAVKFTSPDRPEFVPGTNDPYPCYNTRGQNSLRTGTGRMVCVTKYTEGIPSYRTCPCPECDHSDTPSKVWWKVEVVTARHVVFDESEARQSSCRLWFDDDKSPVVNIYGWKVGWSVTESDRCELYCVTHDVCVGGKMMEMWRRFDVLLDTVWDKYKSHRDDDKMTIIVSHPHGCSKQVSVGHWVHRQEVGGRETRYTYTTCTCPGSSGAAVYRLGSGRSKHPHSGANSGGLNYSGAWVDSDL